jgi:hypothetical protein
MRSRREQQPQRTRRSTVYRERAENGEIDTNNLSSISTQLTFRRARQAGRVLHSARAENGEIRRH